ncbi:MAG: hypothetical protein ACKE9I_05180 [Methylophagaceae bacterium]
MTMRQNLIWLVLLFASINVQAASSFSGDSLRDIYREMHFLHHVGVDIHQRYDFTIPEQIGACDFEVGHNGTRARALVGATNRIEYPNKDELINAAWAVYLCSSCKGDGKICETIPEQLDKIQHVIESGEFD